jgi:hypothetical protein
MSIKWFMSPGKGLGVEPSGRVLAYHVQALSSSHSATLQKKYI